VDVSASSIFDFLKQTFGQMPRAVQVIGWLVFLLLFTFLVLYPLLGVTYVQGKIVPLSDDKTPRSLVGGVRVAHGQPTVTNDDGDFTLAVRVPNLGVLSLDVHVADELLQISVPFPFVALFNPNPSKIYFVPGSTARNKLGKPQSYFLDAAEATNAYRQVRERTGKVSGGGAVDSPRDAPFTLVAKAEAMERRYDVPTYTLRVLELQVNGGARVNEVFFQIRLDGAAVAVEGIPSASSRAVDRLTAVRGVPMRFGELGIPLKNPTGRVELDLLTRGFFRPDKIASIVVDLGKRSVGERFRVDGEQATATVEVLPPVAIGTIGVASSKGQVVSGAWLQVPDKFASSVASVRWYVGDSEFLGSPERYYYRGGISSGNTVKAKVTFTSGSSLTLAAQAQADLREPRTPEELYAAIDLLRFNGDAARALTLTEEALRNRRAERWAFQVRGAILREVGRFEDALSAYGEALRRDPESPATLVGQALTFVDWAGSSTKQLLAAKQSVERAISLEPAAAFAQVALGGVAMRLNDFNGALLVLTRAQEIEQRQGFVRSSSLQRNAYYAGMAYAGLKRIPEARARFTDVIAYTEKDGYRSIASLQLVALARQEMSRL
jgi:tetratricopeptide (TPR) repeat protein